MRHFHIRFIRNEFQLDQITAFSLIKIMVHVPLINRADFSRRRWSRHFQMRQVPGLQEWECRAHGETRPMESVVVALMALRLERTRGQCAASLPSGD
jgi:hypothetical protein